MLLFLYLTNILNLIMEKEISNYSEKIQLKSVFTCFSLLFYLILVGFHDTPWEKAVRFFFCIIVVDAKKKKKISKSIIFK